MYLQLHIVFLLVAVFAFFKWIYLPSLTKDSSTLYLENTWWGLENATKDDTSINPFKINISNEVLWDLKQRLDHARPFTPPLQGLQQQYGVDTDLLKEIVQFWKHRYNWRQREQYLNKLPQFTTNIQGLEIHFIRVKPEPGTRILPILMLHGWGGSVVEFYHIIPLLTTQQKGLNFVFEVIAPSLPGFGFSQAASRPGLGAVQMAVILKNLMKRLGFDEFYVHGGDLGSVIASIMGAVYPYHVLGIHSTMCFVNTIESNLMQILEMLYWPVDVSENKDYENELYPLDTFMVDLPLEFSYSRMYPTKSDTVGIALMESPVALATYLLQKFITWTNPEWKNSKDGGLLEKYSYTQLLDNIMIYWVTNSITTSMRVYPESAHLYHKLLEVERIPLNVPSACAKFKYETEYFPDRVLQKKFKQLVHSKNIEMGGHFATFEESMLLARDIWAAAEKFDTINRRRMHFGDRIIK